MNKKGDKELQMIFGLFILLIISLVVLSLFFKFMKQSETGLRNIAEKTFDENKVSDAENFCRNICSNIQTEDAAIEFCKTAVAIEAGNAVQKHEQFSYGKNIYCEDTIPCFLLIPCPENTGAYGPIECRNMLWENARDYYLKLRYNNTINDGGQSGDCKLPTEPTDPATQRNWVYRYCYYQGKDGIVDDLTSKLDTCTFP
jgi:hypothetical protein